MARPRKYPKGHRRCWKCLQLKAVEEFVKDIKKSGKRGYLCKKCHYEYVQKWRKRNPEKIEEYNAKYSKGLTFRFKILLRDNFICQYCGRKAPEVILETDHIVPKSKGLKKSYKMEDYVTACRDCNRGKSDILI